MTENQRNYLADLAGRKGVRLFDTDNWSVARASEEIENLKAMPDAVFDEPTPENDAVILDMIAKAQKGIESWNLQ